MFFHSHGAPPTLAALVLRALASHAMRARAALDRPVSGVALVGVCMGYLWALCVWGAGAVLCLVLPMCERAKRPAAWESVCVTKSQIMV